MTSGFASRDLRSKWQEPSGTPPATLDVTRYLVSSSVVENTCLLPRRNDIRLRISRPIGRNLIQIIIWISLCSMWQEPRPAVAISFRLSSEFHCAQWPQVLVSSSGLAVSSSVVENTSQWHQGSHLETCGRNFIQIIIWISLCSMWQIQRPAVAISFRLSSEFHCARCDTLPCQFERSRCQFEHFEIWFAKIKWRSDRRSREHVILS